MKPIDYFAAMFLALLMIASVDHFTISGGLVFLCLGFGWVALRCQRPRQTLIFWGFCAIYVLCVSVFSMARSNSEEWRNIRKFYEGQGITLSRHDQGVIKRAANAAGVTSSRVILTLILHPRVPDADHMPEESDKIAMFNRIGRVYYATNWHPIVVSKVAKADWQKFYNALYPYSAPMEERRSEANNFIY